MSLPETGVPKHEPGSKGKSVGSRWSKLCVAPDMTLQASTVARSEQTNDAPSTLSSASNHAFPAPLSSPLLDGLPGWFCDQAAIPPPDRPNLLPSRSRFCIHWRCTTIAVNRPWKVRFAGGGFATANVRTIVIPGSALFDTGISYS
jgi:hypothetical protein